VREASPISHVDIMPTVLRLAGLKADVELAGEDLRPAMMGHGNRDRAVYSEFYGEGESHGQLPFKHLMYRQGAYKLIASHIRPKKGQVRYELYNVENDPWEMRNLADSPAEDSTFQTLRDALMAIWHKQQTKLPNKMPRAMARSKYKIAWPADPWKAVEPVATAPASAPNKQAGTASTKPSGVSK
jgi:arylsulfatase A-like enzyme